RIGTGNQIADRLFGAFIRLGDRIEHSGGALVDDIDTPAEIGTNARSCRVREAMGEVELSLQFGAHPSSYHAMPGNTTSLDTPVTTLYIQISTYTRSRPNSEHEQRGRAKPDSNGTVEKPN